MLLQYPSLFFCRLDYWDDADEFFLTQADVKNIFSWHKILPEHNHEEIAKDHILRITELKKFSFISSWTTEYQETNKFWHTYGEIDKNPLAVRIMTTTKKLKQVLEKCSHDVFMAHVEYYNEIDAIEVGNDISFLVRKPKKFHSEKEVRIVISPFAQRHNPPASIFAPFLLANIVDEVLVSSTASSEQYEIVKNKFMNHGIQSDKIRKSTFPILSGIEV